MASKLLLSPSEVKLKEVLKDKAITSELCEEKGADILIYSPSGLLGIQRKSLPGDFIQSMTDGRFARALPLMTENCTFCRVVCEGKFTYWPDGTLFLGKDRKGKRIPSRFTRNTVHGMLNDIEFVYGIPIRYTENVDDTVRYIESLQRYLDSKKHVSLFKRPKATGAWSVPSRKDIHLWIMQSFQGIGVNTADKIVSHFGRAPLRWTCSSHELSKAANVSLVRADEWINCLEDRLSKEPSKPVSGSSASGEKTMNDLRRMLMDGKR